MRYPCGTLVGSWTNLGNSKRPQALSLATFKKVHWFPKLTCGVGERSWAYDGEIERTSNAVVASAASAAMSASRCLRSRSKTCRSWTRSSMRMVWTLTLFCFCCMYCLSYLVCYSCLGFLGCSWYISSGPLGDASGS